MTPRERLLRAMTGGETDFIPCSIYFNGNLRVDGYDCSSRADAVRLGLDLGTDPFVSVGLGSSVHPDVETRAWVETPEDEPYPVLRQEWRLGGRTLVQGVRLPPEADGRRSISWRSDLTVSTLCEPLVKKPEDVEIVRELLVPLTEEDARAARASQADAFALAREHDLLTIATYGQGLFAPMCMLGAENAVYFAVDHPDAFDALAEAVHRVEMRNIDAAKDAGVDMLKRFGGYEMTNFYNPGIFDRVVAPRLRREVARAHELDLPVYYRVVTGMEPLLDRIADIGFDCIEGGEPRLSGCSLEDWRDAFAGRAASWTGVSTPVLLGGDDPDAVREEVRRACGLFGRKGFVLGVTNSIRNHFPWENTFAMIDEWKRVR